MKMKWKCKLQACVYCGYDKFIIKDNGYLYCSNCAAKKI